MTWNFGTTKTVSCYHEPKKLFDHDGVSYYASDEDGAEEFSGGLVLNLTPRPHILPSHSIPELKNHFDIRFDEIMVPCPDFGLPAVKPTFWDAIHDYSVNKGYKKVCVHCVQGHGRTGTVMSALLINLKGMGVKRAVTKVREDHCRFAVESDKQIRYLRELDYYKNNRKINEDDGLEGSSSLIKDLAYYQF